MPLRDERLQALILLVGSRTYYSLSQPGQVSCFCPSDRGDVFAIRLNDVFASFRPANHKAHILGLHEHVMWPSPLDIIDYFRNGPGLAKAQTSMFASLDTWIYLILVIT
jgi:hypothetical protein